jgi:aspartate-semialdehyde dehydrogenase
MDRGGWSQVRLRYALLTVLRSSRGETLRPFDTGGRVSRGRRVVAIVGATGLVGSEIARVLAARRFPLSELRLFASGRKSETTVRPFRLAHLAGCDICFLAAGGPFSIRYAMRIAALGAVVIDNSSAFRMEPTVPLVVPEVNPEDIAAHHGVIANPNCSTIQMVVALAPLHRRWGLTRVVVATYQAVTGAGLEAGGELASQAVAALEGGHLEPRVFPHPIAFNLIPAIGCVEADGYTVEERKMLNETRKILKDDTIRVSATAVRVPVFRGHSEAVYAEFARPVDATEARRTLEAAPGISVVDDPVRDVYPTPLEAAGRDLTFVGRLRRDPGSDRALSMWIVSDNVRKGAALNAVQIAEGLR